MATTARYKYESNANNIFFARTDSDDELASIRGTEPTATQTEYLTFEFSKNSREVGCRPRHALLVRTIGTGSANNCLEDGGKAFKRTIVLSPTHFDNLQIGTSVTVDSQEYKVQAKIVERMV